MPTNIGLYSYGSALVAYCLLTAWVFLTRRNRPLGLPFLIAIALTTVWAGSIVVSSLLTSPQIKLMQLTEVARNAAWSFVLLQFLGIKLHGSTHILNSRRWIPWFIAGFGAVLCALFATPYLSRIFALPHDLYRDVAFAAWLAMSILGLLLLEQIFRNSDESERWSTKHLSLGLGFLFAYDFFMYAEALMFRQLDATLWQARGFVLASAAIFLAIGMGRYDSNQNTLKLNLSRHVVFHSVTLMAAGVYLILMATAGYFIRYYGGSWGGVLQIAFLCAAGLLLAALLFSGQIRTRTRVWLSKNFFSYKYDYRTEWLQFTKTLAEGGENIPQNIIRSIANFTRSSGGLLWTRTETNNYELTLNWEMAAPDKDSDMGSMPQWLQQTEWIIELTEWQRSPDIYGALQMPAFLLATPRARLIIPLMFGDQLQGILLLRESDLQTSLNWEDRDLLKMAGRQAASHLAQYQANQALVESRQFEAFNRLSAYVIHDLKNILAQQSLIVSNAAKHRSNPVFIDDVFNTIDNSVQRMTRLMEQMSSGMRGKSVQVINVMALLDEIVAVRMQTQPSPTLKAPDSQVCDVVADREQLGTVFSHIVQNAQEATSKTGTVAVQLIKEGNQVVIEIEDDGVGMSEEFLRDRLFKPFDSTKGLTGMGIGAFESREFVRELGGDIQVRSTLGNGSLFRIVLPCHAESLAHNLVEKEVCI